MAERGCQRLAGTGRYSSSLASLPPPAAGYSLSPYCFPVLLAPAKAHSDFHKTEQRKVLKCRELSRQHTESPPPASPQNLESPPVSSSYKHPIPIPLSHTTVQLSTSSHSLQSSLCDEWLQNPYVLLPNKQKGKFREFKSPVLLLIHTLLFSALCGERGGQS